MSAPPFDIEAEECVLGAAMMSPKAVADAVQHLRPDDFYRDAHQAVFEAIRGRALRGEPVDAVLVARDLRARGVLDDLDGGPAYLHMLVSFVPTVANAPHYRRIIFDFACLRALIDTATRASQDASAAPTDVDGLLRRVAEEIVAIANRRKGQS